VGISRGRSRRGCPDTGTCRPATEHPCARGADRIAHYGRIARVAGGTSLAQIRGHGHGFRAARHAARVPSVDEVADVHAHRHRVGRPRHRRERGDLHLGRPGPPARTSHPEPARDGAGDLRRLAPRLELGRRHRALLPDVRGAARPEQGLLRNVRPFWLRVPGRRKRAARTRGWGARLRHLLSRARCAPGRGPATERRRRSHARGASGGGAEPRVLDQPLRRRPRRRRPIDGHQRPSLHDRRRGAGGFRGHRAGPPDAGFRAHDDEGANDTRLERARRAAQPVGTRVRPVAPRPDQRAGAGRARASLPVAAPAGPRGSRPRGGPGERAATLRAECAAAR